MKKLRAYAAKKFPEELDAEGLVIERALNSFLSEKPS
jgi:hypothetical protein